MIIKNITLKNFKSYEDEVTIDLSPSSEKNIILIGGENGAGKSTLFEAIKLCFYGSTAYGYIGDNYRYMNKIKNMINNHAYLQETVQASINISLIFDHSETPEEYSLLRSWTINNSALQEQFLVSRNGLALKDEDLSYFHQYLTSTLPPTMFDFFFFDGDELNSFFKPNSTSSKIKNSLLQLMNYDTFDILRSHLQTYQKQQSKNNKTLEDMDITYDESHKKLIQLRIKKQELSKQFELLNIDIESLQIQKDNLRTDFIKNGGLLDKERDNLSSQLILLENMRSELTTNIRAYCNDTLPLLLVESQLHEIRIQIHSEENLSAYNVTKDVLSPDLLKYSIRTHTKSALSDTVVNSIINDLLNELYDLDSLDSTNEIFALNRNQSSAVQNRISNILDNIQMHKKLPNDTYGNLTDISNQIKLIRIKLNSSTSSDFASKFEQAIDGINNKIQITNIELEKLSTLLDLVSNDIAVENQNFTKIKNKKYSQLLGINTTSMSVQIISYLEDLISHLTREKTEELESKFMEIFSKIIRKSDFIDLIKFDDDFEPTLYIKRVYSLTEITNIVNNVGVDSIEIKYGTKFLTTLFSQYNITHLHMLIDALNTQHIETVTLPTKVQLSSLSNGEKQLYVLCLIWSILKVSNVEIPFIIDTPYSRIDSTHRFGLTTQYFPSVSKQVIILSTNEEIDSDLFHTLEPYIANKYLLTYDTAAQKTNIINDYFEV